MCPGVLSKERAWARDPVSPPAWGSCWIAPPPAGREGSRRGAHSGPGVGVEGPVDGHGVSGSAGTGRSGAIGTWAGSWPAV